ncbi:MAG TPA: hypothetical protein VFC19_41250 [Candidatus Limnocylindrales bacterium]|nr:hypothetical protein [Candidatus Limnocylindrales bacterium]
MSDPTTDGLVATAAEIEGMVRNLCAYALGEPDPIQRYEDLTHQQVLFAGMVEAIRRERGKLVADLVVAGLSVTDIAAQTSLGTVVKVRKLISLADETQRVNEATAARKAAAREAADREAADREAAVREAAVREAADREAADREAAEVEETPAEEPASLPPHLAAPTGKRLLTPADRAALGLSVPTSPPSRA